MLRFRFGGGNRTQPDMNILVNNKSIVISMLKDDKSITDACKHFEVSRDTFAQFRRKYIAVQRALTEKEKRRMMRFKRNQ